MWWGMLPEGPFVVLGVLLSVAFWVGLVILIIWVVRQFRPGSPPSVGGDDPAMRILEERFARGEIDADEFQRRREVLRGPR